MGIKLNEIPLKEYVLPGTRLCSGCGLQLAYRMALKALGDRTIVTIPASCSTVMHGMQGFSAVNISVLHTTFETTAASASGIAASLKARGIEDVNVVAWAGDGGTADIGIQGLSGAAERQDDFIYVCYDNESYMNTGTQRSGATPKGAMTTTTPVAGKTQWKKDVVKIMEAHQLSYIATANASYPQDLMDKIQKAKEFRGQGVRYIHIFSPCPPGWGYKTEETIEMGRLANQTGLWPLFEKIHGKLSISPASARYMQKENRRDLREYLGKQERFSQIKEEQIVAWEKHIDYTWKKMELELTMQEELGSYV